MGYFYVSSISTSLFWYRNAVRTETFVLFLIYMKTACTQLTIIWALPFVYVYVHTISFLYSHLLYPIFPFHPTSFSSVYSYYLFHLFLIIFLCNWFLLNNTTSFFLGGVWEMVCWQCGNDITTELVSCGWFWFHATRRRGRRRKQCYLEYSSLVCIFKTGLWIRTSSSAHFLSFFFTCSSVCSSTYFIDL